MPRRGRLVRLLRTVRGCDFVVLVTEPTPFGLNDLVLAVETMRQLELPFGVVINRADVGDARVTDYCAVERIPVLLEIPDDRRIAVAYSRGELAIDAVPETRVLFERLRVRIEESLSANSSGTPAVSRYARADTRDSELSGADTQATDDETGRANHEAR